MQTSSVGTAAHEAAESTLAFASCSHGGKPFLVLIHSAAEPDPGEWRAYLQAVTQALATTSTLVHTFVVTDGGGPNAAQRKELAEVIEAGRGDLLTHVFTTDRFVRGIVTAFRWIARARAIAHAPGDFSPVCAECGFPAAAIMKALGERQQNFPNVRTLQLVVETQGTR